MTNHTRNIDARDALALVGILMLGGGLWWVYPPAALIIVGVILLALALVSVRKAPKEKR